MKKILLPLLLVFSAQTFAEEQKYVGYYTEGFEMSYFVKCGSDVKFWVGDDPAILQLKKALSSDGIKFTYDLGNSSPIVPVILEGMLSKEGRWGHLGMYKYKLHVTNYIAYGKEAKIECNSQ